jgi:hypothetical protein
MTFLVQKSFGEFIVERYGPKWVYAQRTSDRLKARYPDSVVITPKQQRQLAVDYKREWGQEYDRSAWFALCALRAAKQAISLHCAVVCPDTLSDIDFAIAALTT